MLIEKKYRAKEVKAIRKKLSLSQSKFAELLNVSLKTVTRWEENEGTIYTHNAPFRNFLNLAHVVEDKKGLEIILETIKTFGIENTFELIGALGLIIKARRMGGLWEKAMIEAIRNFLENYDSDTKKG